jgi:hypothetical protein
LPDGHGSPPHTWQDEGMDALPAELDVTAADAETRETVFFAI